MKEEKIIWQKDGSEMVLIPGGSFEIRGHFDEGGNDQRPVHTSGVGCFLHGYPPSNGEAIQKVCTR